jgi:exosortase J
LPKQMGRYHLQRVWSEQDWLGHLAYRWAAYLDDGSSDEIDMALWLGPGAHYPIVCHISRGERPSWQLVNTLPTADGSSASFALYLYEEPTGQTLEATTICDVRGCNEQAILQSQTGIGFASMGVDSLLFHPTATPLSVVIRTQSHNFSLSAEENRERLLRDVQDFISDLNAHALTHFAESRNQL